MNRNVLSAFYTGNDNKYGFAAYNTPPPNYLKLLSQFSYPSTRNNTIDNYFRKKETIKSMHTDFVPSQYKLPPISDKNPLIDFSKRLEVPIVNKMKDGELKSGVRRTAEEKKALLKRKNIFN